MVSANTKANWAIVGGGFLGMTLALRLAKQGEEIVGFRADEYYWRDLGRPENVAQAEQDLKNNVL